MEPRSYSDSYSPGASNTASDISPMQRSNQDKERSEPSVGRFETQEIASPGPRRRKRIAAKTKQLLIMEAAATSRGVPKPPVVFNFHILEKDGRKASIPRRDFICPYCNKPAYDAVSLIDI